MAVAFSYQCFIALIELQWISQFSIKLHHWERLNGHFYGWHHIHMICSICMFCVQYLVKYPISTELAYIIQFTTKSVYRIILLFFYFGGLEFFWQGLMFHLFLVFAMEAFLMSSLSYQYLAKIYLGSTSFVCVTMSRMMCEWKLLLKASNNIQQSGKIKPGPSIEI